MRAHCAAIATLLAVIVIATPPAPGLAEEASTMETLILRVGGSKVFDASNIANVDQPARNVASTKLVDDPPQLIVTGEEVGQATMILWVREPKGDRKTILIDVVQQLPQEIEKEIKDILQAEARFARIKTKVVGAKVLLFNVPDKPSYEHLEAALKIYEEQAIVLPPGPPNLGEQLRELLSEYRDVKVVESSPTLIVVRGKCPPRAEPRIKALLKQVGTNEYGVRVVDLVEADRARKQIELRFGFAEMKVEDISRLGVNWADRIDIALSSTLQYSTANPSTTRGTTSTNPFKRLAGAFTGQAGITSFGILIDIAKIDTVGRIHDEYVVIVADGSEATYDRKGTIYTEVEGVNTAELKEVDFGTLIKTKPELIDDQRVELTVDATVSSLVPSVAGRQDLTVLKNTTKQTVQVELGKSLVLWDTLQNLDRQTVDAVKGLGAIPAIGAFFKSKDFNDEKSEAVIWIEPRLITPDDERNQRMKSLLKRMWKPEL